MTYPSQASRADRIVALCERYTEAQITADELVTKVVYILSLDPPIISPSRDDIAELIMEDGGL